MHAQSFFIARSIYDYYRFDITRFRAEPTDYETVHTGVTHSHIAVPTTTRFYATRNPRVKCPATLLVNIKN